MSQNESQKNPLTVQHVLPEFGFTLVGVDEVGRGCLAGPVSACAYAFRDGFSTAPRLRDSKKLSASVRESLVPVLEAYGFSGHGSATALEVDELGINAANFLAMRRAVIALAEASSISLSRLHVVVDGNQVPPFVDLVGRLQCLVKADDLLPAVSAASVLAKVRRDRWMSEMDATFPGYGFGSHAGYGTKAHMDAIEVLGPCSLHRMSFSLSNKRNTPPRP